MLILSYCRPHGLVMLPHDSSILLRSPPSEDKIEGNDGYKEE